MGSRREARETALSILYSADRRGEDPAEVLAAQPVPPPDYAADIVSGVAGHADELDELIDSYSEGWRTDRMPAVDRALLRMAVFELVHRPDVPTEAVLTEVVELAADYSTERSGRFVNGVASRIAELHRPTPDGA
ncbi:MAG: transcription antitermination factor NusB [Actinobacteria bacterium]|nr:transcription antitermination factor NusB [Actinomycetota bacterium]